MSTQPRKICMVGDFGVGKTSLVSRFVRQTFDEKYLSTVGVKVDTKEMLLGDRLVRLVLWDIAGRNALDTVAASYLRGASGLVLVADGTREASLRSAAYLHMQSKSILGLVPNVLMVNKLDLVEQWEIKPSTLSELRRTWSLAETSAATGDGVEAAFRHLAEQVFA